MRFVCMYCGLGEDLDDPSPATHGICPDCAEASLPQKDLFAGVVTTARARGVDLPTGAARFERVLDGPDGFVLSVASAAALLAGGVLPGDEPLLARTVAHAGLDSARMRAIEHAIDPELASYVARRILPRSITFGD